MRQAVLITRRQMMVGLLGLGAGAGLPVKLAARVRASGSPFEADRRRALSAAAERVLPGAVEAGVPEYIDYWMAREPFSHLVEPLLRIGAVHLDRIAGQEHSRAFADCKPGQQDAILKRFQAGELKLKKFDGRQFFEHLVRFTLEGFLGDPKYGGNRDLVGWKFIGRSECWWQPRNLDLILMPWENVTF